MKKEEEIMKKLENYHFLISFAESIMVMKMLKN